MEYLSHIWRNTEFLRSISAFLQWSSITLVFLGGLLQVGKFIVDRHEKELAREEQELARKSQEIKVLTLETEISKQQTKFMELKNENELARDKVDELSNPYIKPIRTGTVTVQVIIESNENINFNYLDQGGYFGLGKGNKEIIGMEASNCWGKKTGDNAVTFKGVYNMDVSHHIIGSPVYKLKDAEYAQISFVPMKKDARIIGGYAICTINDMVQMRLNIPPSQMHGEKIIIHNIKEMFSEFHK